jgi:hypothetical protein
MVTLAELYNGLAGGSVDGFMWHTVRRLFLLGAIGGAFFQT